MLAEVAQPVLGVGSRGSSALTIVVLFCLRGALTIGRFELAQRHERWLDTALRVGLGEPVGKLGQHLVECSEGLWLGEGAGIHSWQAGQRRFAERMRALRALAALRSSAGQA